MRQGGAKRKKILRYLKESSGKPILPEDVSNMITKMRREFHTAPDDNVRVTEVLEDFSEDISHETHGGPISRSHLCRRYAWHKYQQITTLQLHGSQGNGVMSHNAKYRAAFQICKRIAEVITDKATSKFNRWLENPKDLERTAREDDDPDQIAAPL
ncbi:hypothetical protein PC113_g21919 [Phytophthora cactorum]|uniref:Uncharacterized protein n=1 Tax=Phytophthora cactorum TaxID=29920 RepID=A0A8T0YHN1_9STRA|nr:hypothetical protein PC113_g21919 [Phytophthora cactorum]KAG2876009.1 hypothetical protein PC114_g24413 [Phytophthora cactorum]KAG2891307.1 hypothetical protein PC117_g24269 [Phytophthora cactorum]KAG3044060.1 hypothetical protein PC121_g22150 [Phytophthora cactorum]